jgi:hypothetical protein
MRYNDPVWLGRRRGIDSYAVPKLEAIGASLGGIAAEATAAKSDVSGA